MCWRGSVEARLGGLGEGLGRKAVADFTSGPLPFAADHLVVVTSARTEPIQILDELAALRRKYPKLTLDLWGAEVLRLRFVSVWSQ
ncbi:hypothetical protein Asi03nite_60230 [Actinoplanes siamensis]|uniref:Uncharacterized protein n=1 Tax=Actinoplanes siamensis TaxID=1223317 RepID=A0A919TP23_9ACTN|nr:hypothetical protein Asi03nite_60230 [Actinoplanes siamensis]